MTANFLRASPLQASPLQASPLQASPLQASPRLRVDCIENIDVLEALAPQWAALEARTPEATGFQSPGWCLSWARASGAQARVLAVYEDERLVMLWPLQIDRRLGARVARWLGEPMTQYGDALAEPGEGRPRWFAAAREAFGQWRDVDLFAFTRLRADSVLAAFEQARDAMEGERLEAPFVRAGQALPGQRSMARRARRLAALGNAHLVEAGSPAQRMALGRQALDFKRRWLRCKGFFSAGLSHPAAEAFIARAARDGALRAYALSVGGETAAVEIGLVGGGVYRSFLSAFDGKFAQGSPGQTLTRLVIERCAAEGLSGYDMLPPADAYKRAWATETTLVHAALVPVSWKGALAAFALAKLRPRAKRAVRLLAAARRFDFSRLVNFGNPQKPRKLDVHAAPSGEIRS